MIMHVVKVYEMKLDRKKFITAKEFINKADALTYIQEQFINGYTTDLFYVII